jgi:hypothetical protein
MLFKNSVRTSKRTPHFTITKINWLTLFKFNANRLSGLQQQRQRACVAPPPAVHTAEPKHKHPTAGQYNDGGCTLFTRLNANLEYLTTISGHDGIWGQKALIAFQRQGHASPFTDTTGKKREGIGASRYLAPGCLPSLTQRDVFGHAEATVLELEPVAMCRRAQTCSNP